jgi:TP901 family phage tail tape measure protein
MNVVPAAILGVLVQARGIKQTNTGLASVHGGMERTGKAGTAMGSRIARGAKIAAAGLAVVLGLGFGSAISKGMEFEKRMDSLGAVMEASTVQSKRLERQALKQGEATAYSANEVAEAQVELAKGGLKAEQVLGGALPAALSLAAAGELELGEAATATVNAMKLFGLEGREAQKVADMMATAANTTTADVLDFAMALKQGGSAAKQAGLDMNESMVILESLAEAGIKNSDAGTSMKAMLIQLLKPTEKQADLAEELGIQWESQNGTIKSAVGLSRELREATDDMTKAERVKTLAVLAGTDGFRTLAALYDAGPKKLRELAVANNQAGTAQEVAGKKMDNLTGDVDELGGAFETLQIKLMGGASPALRQITQDATGMVQEISRIASNPALSEEEKFSRIFGLVADASGAALAKIVQQAAHFGPKFVSALAGGIAREWVEMSPLAKVLSVAVLVRAMGGKGAIMASGAAIGRLMGAGVTTGIATEVAASAPMAAAAATVTAGSLPAAAAGAAAGGWRPGGPALGAGAAKQAAATSTSRAILTDAFGGMTLAAAGASMEKAAKPGMWSRVSSKIGTGLGTATGAVAGTAMASGIASRLRNFKWGRLGGVGLGLWVADEAIGAFSRRADDSDDALVALKKIKDSTGIFDAGLFESRSDLETQSQKAHNLLAQYEQMAEGRVRISLATEESLRSQARELDLTKEQKAQLESMFNLMRMGRDLDVKVGLDADPKKLLELKNGFSLLRSGALTSMNDIAKVVRRNSAIIAQNVDTSSKEGRDKLAENYRDAATAIGKAMHNGDISVKQGLAKMKALFRNADLISGEDPLGIARGFASSWKKAGGINAQQRKDMIADLGKMPEAARQQAFNAMVKYGQGLVKGGKMPKQDLRDFKSAVLAQFSDLRTKGSQSSLDLAIGVAGNFGAMGEAVAGVLQVIQDNSNSALTKFGAKKLSFVVKAVGNFLGFGGGKEQSKQTGGFIVPGSGSGDRPGFAGEVGAFVMNREATRAYGFNKGGMVPLALEPGERYFSRPEVKAMGGAGKLEAINRSVPRFQNGGEIGKPQIAGPAGPLLDIGRGATDPVAAAAQAFVEKHRPKPQTTGGVGGYTGPPPGMKQLGDNAWVDSHTMAVGQYLASKFRATITDGWRPQDASYGAVNSSHKRGTPSNPGALDFAPPSTAMQAFAGKHIAGLTENDIHDWGTGLHNHIAFFRLGGLIQALAGGGGVGAEFQKRAQHIWDSAAPYFGRSAKSTMPTTYVDDLAPGVRGQVSTSKGRRYAWLDRPVAKGVVAGNDPAEKTLLHEWAHIHQNRQKAKLRQREGGAEAFAFMAGPQIMAKACLPYSPPGVPRKYFSAYEVAMNKGRDWVLREQFAQCGGLVQHLASGGSVADWDALVGGSSGWDNDELATLAHLVRMQSPGYMAQKAQGESSGDRKARGNDAAAGYGNTWGLGLWQITTGVGNEDIIAKHGGEDAMFHPYFNARAAKEIQEDNPGAWFAPPTGPKGQVQPDLARRMQGVIGGKGADVQGLTEGEKKAAEGKKRKGNYQERLRKVEQEVNQAQSAPAKQSKLWKLIKLWGRVGIFDEDERSHIIGAVQNAAAQVKPQGAVGILSGLAGYAKNHGEVTGQDPSNFRSLEKAIERAQDRGRDQRTDTIERQKKRVEQVKARVASKIEKRAAFPELVAQLAGLRTRADEGEEYASQLVTLEPEDITDAYVQREREAYGDELNRLLAWRNMTVRAQDAASREIAKFQEQITDVEALNIGVDPAMAARMGGKGKKQLGGLVEFLARGGESGAGKRAGKGGAKGKGAAGLGGPSNTFAAYKKAAYKIPLLEEAIVNAKTMRDETWAGELEEIQGLSGPVGLIDSLPSEPQAGAFGGRIFEIQNSIRELALKVDNAKADASDSGASELKELEAQLNVDWRKRFLVSEAQRNTIRGFEANYPGGRYAGMFATGGHIGRGQWGIAGETGEPEIVQGPARVYSPSESAEMMGGGDGELKIVVNGDIVQPQGDTRDPVEAFLNDRRVKAYIEKTARDGRATGRVTPGGRS